jgi:hypothetical protein
MGTDYMWLTGVQGLNWDAAHPMVCSTLDAPAEVKKKEWCRFAPGNPFAKAVLAVILARERLNAGHIYGDKAMDYLLDTIDEALKLDPTLTLDYIRSQRFTTEHCGFSPRPDQIQRLGRFNMYLACSGYVLSRSYPSLQWYGAQYGKWLSPIKSLIQAGAHPVLEATSGRGRGGEEESGMTLATDRVTTFFNDGYVLITRKNAQGVVVAPEEAIDRVTLMKMATSWAAEYAIREKYIGTLEVGKFADLLVLNKDYFTIPEEQILEVYPIMTVVGGKIEVLRKEFAQELGRESLGAQPTFVHGPWGTVP